MARYKAILAYDGTAYSGFQRQPNAPTVQGEFETALRLVGWLGDSTLGAGRTDSGVHASGQVIAFDFDWAHSPDDLRNALNAHLPDDIAVREVGEAAAHFHPRYDAVARRYAYRILRDGVRHPLRERYAWRVRDPLDPDLLGELAGNFLGTMDFSGFGSPPDDRTSPVRTVTISRWQPDADELRYEVEANAFLFRMVRRMVFAQIETATGRLAGNTIERLLNRADPGMLQGMAPPHGLCLVSVRYP
jgi:tRNA pseudouridine38-40 synthase